MKRRAKAALQKRANVWHRDMEKYGFNVTDPICHLTNKHQAQLVHRGNCGKDTEPTDLFLAFITLF